MTADGLGISSFGDLRVWREAERAARAALELADAGTAGGGRGVLLRELARVALGPPQRIAAGYAASGRVFLRELARARKEAAALRALVRLAVDVGAAVPEVGGKVEEAIDALEEALREHRRYLANRELSRRYRQTEGT